MRERFHNSSVPTIYSRKKKTPKGKHKRGVDRLSLKYVQTRIIMNGLLRFQTSTVTPRFRHHPFYSFLWSFEA